MRAGKREAIQSNATPSPVLGATMVKGLSLGEFEAPQYKGSFLVHGETPTGQIATCSLVNKTRSGRNTYELNGRSLASRSGIPMPSEAPSSQNIQAWMGWVELVNFYHPAGLPAQVVEVDGEFSMRFPEQASEKKKASFVVSSESEVDAFIFGETESEESADSEGIAF